MCIIAAWQCTRAPSEKRDKKDTSCLHTAVKTENRLKDLQRGLPANVDLTLSLTDLSFCQAGSNDVSRLQLCFFCMITRQLIENYWMQMKKKKKTQIKGWVTKLPKCGWWNDLSVLRKYQLTLYHKTLARTYSIMHQKRSPCNYKTDSIILLQCIRPTSLTHELWAVFPKWTRAAGATSQLLTTGGLSIQLLSSRLQQRLMAVTPKHELTLRHVKKIRTLENTRCFSSFDFTWWSFKLTNCVVCLLNNTTTQTYTFSVKLSICI